MQSVEDPAVAKEVRVLPSQSTRFDLSDPEQETAMLKFLEEHGYAVVANVASVEEIELSKGMFWDFWEKAQVRGPIKRDNLESWKHWMANSATGIITGVASCNHNDFSWNSRTLPGVKNAFAKVWQDDRLVVSFDASGAFRPYEPHMEWLTNGGWWHVDQNHLRGPHRQGRITVQGLVTYYDATELTGGLCVIPGSHRHHAEVCARAPTAKMNFDYVTVPKTDPVLSSAQAILVCCRAGDLVLWDSRTVHCNTPALHLVNHFADKLKQSEMRLKQNQDKLNEAISLELQESGQRVKTLSEQSAASTAAELERRSSSTSPQELEESEQRLQMLHEETTVAINAEMNARKDRLQQLHDQYTASVNVPSAPTPSSTHPTTTSSIETVSSDPPELIRLVSYVCMIPRAGISSSQMYNRKQAFVHRRATSHYPALEVLTDEKRAAPWTTREDILQLVGYSEKEIKDIHEGRLPGAGWVDNCTIC